MLPNGIKIGISMKEAQYKDTSLVPFSDKEGIWKSDEGYFISEDLTNNTVGVITSGIKDMDLF